MSAAANQVWEVSTFTGTGNVSGLSVVVKTFNTAFGTGGTDLFRYYIANRDVPGEYEEGTGHLSDTTTLVRDTVIASSNGGSAVNFSAGTKDVTNDVSIIDILTQTLVFGWVDPTAAAEAGGNITIDVENGSKLHHQHILTGNETLLDPVNMVDGSTIYIDIDPDSNTLTFDTSYVGSDFTSGSLPPVSTRTLMTVVRSGTDFIVAIVAEA